MQALEVSRGHHWMLYLTLTSPVECIRVHPKTFNSNIHFRHRRASEKSGHVQSTLGSEKHTLEPNPYHA